MLLESLNIPLIVESLFESQSVDSVQKGMIFPSFVYVL